MNIELAFITYNRLEYTKKSLESILADPEEEFDLTIWDNASTDGTRDYLDSVDDPRIVQKIFSKENIGQTAAVNRIWSESKADLLGKLDNDCVVTSGWTRTLAKAHKDIPELGVVAMWHFFEEDFDYEHAKHKIQEFNGHKILRHPWTCGTGLLMKRKTFEKLGAIKQGATTRYWLKMAREGYINGFYYPLIFQENMDDPKSEYSLFHKKSFKEAFKDTYGHKIGVNDMATYMKNRKEIIENLLTGPYDPKYYLGWRLKARQSVKKIKNLLQGEWKYL